MRKRALAAARGDGNNVVFAAVPTMKDGATRAHRRGKGDDEAGGRCRGRCAAALFCSSAQSRIMPAATTIAGSASSLREAGAMIRSFFPIAAQTLRQPALAPIAALSIPVKRRRGSGARAHACG